jgi:hypothetical protein
MRHAIARRMGVYRFEDLRVWQAARKQCDRVGGLINRPEFRRDRPLSDQMNAAAKDFCDVATRRCCNVCGIHSRRTAN